MPELFAVAFYRKQSLRQEPSENHNSTPFRLIFSLVSQRAAETAGFTFRVEVH
jgi:hypothetical protein